MGNIYVVKSIYNKYERDRMKIIIARAMVTNTYKSEKGYTYITLAERLDDGSTSTIELQSKEIDLTDIPALEPVSIDAEVSGYKYKDKPVSLSVVSMSVKKL